MATLDDSPSLYLGQQWTHWAEKVEGKSKNDHPKPREECCSSDDGDTIKLRHQDMPLYGLCPARDEFYLVVCECCEQVIKPQALKRHIEQRHGHASPRTSGARRSKGSPGRHSGSPARHSGSPGRRTSPKRESHGKTPPINPPGVKSSSKSSGSSHRSGSANSKSKKSNHSMPVVKVERMLPSDMVGKANSSPNTKTANSKHDHSDHKEHKHDKDHREHHKEHREHTKEHKEHTKEHKHEKDHKEHREKDREKDHREHHKDHREHSREHKDRDHRHDKDHKDYKEKDHSKEKEHKEHNKEREHFEREREKESKEKDHKQDRDRDRDRDKEKEHSKEKGHREKDYSREREHKDKHDREHREKEREHKEKDHHKEHRDYKDHKDHKEKEHKDHKDHREKKLNTNTSSSASLSQTTPSVTPPRPSSSQKNATSSPSPSMPSNASSMASPLSKSEKGAKFMKEKMLPCKDREFDANKHCGVWIPEIARNCTRSLTCKTHALSLRRAVQGRRKPFDELLKEHRAAREAFLKLKAEEKAAAAGKLATASTASSASNSKSSSSTNQQRESLKDTPNATSAAAKAAACNASPVAKSGKAPPKVTSPSPSRPAPPPPQSREETPSAADSLSRLSSDGEDDDDDRDRLGFPQLSYHPRPAAMNTFGARIYAGSSCMAFNRKSDLLRAAFQACVERHLHPPPHKKLCVESKLPEGSHIATNSQDPYDFPTMDMGSLTTNGLSHGLGSPTSTHNSSLMSPWNSNKLSGKVKPKSSSGSASLSERRNSKPKDHASSKGAGVTSPVAMLIGGPVTSPITPFTPMTSVTPVNPLSRTGSQGGSLVSGATGVKRKRSGSGTQTGGLTMNQIPGSLTVSHSTSAGNPISISIPSGSLNLANLTQAQLNSISVKVSGNQMLPSGQQQVLSASAAGKNHQLKDINLVMTSHDPGVMNGQLITTPLPTSAIADFTSLQLNSLSGETNTAVPTQTHKTKKEKRLKLSHNMSGNHNSSHIDGVGATLSTLTSLPGGVMVMPDITGQQTTVTEGFGSTGLLSTSPDFSTTKLSPSTTSPLFASGSTSPQTSETSPLANGMFGHGLELKVKGLPVNHVAGAMMVSPGSVSSTTSPAIVNTDQHRSSSSSKGTRLGSVSSKKSSGSRSKSHRSQQLAPQVAASQQLTAATLTLSTTGNRLLPAMYTMGASSGQFQHIQIQPKAGNKQTLATGKLSVQPMSLTLPMGGMATVTSPQQQAHATLLLQNDDHHSGAHHAAAAQQLPNSPSNVLS